MNKEWNIERQYNRLWLVTWISPKPTLFFGDFNKKFLCTSSINQNAPCKVDSTATCDSYQQHWKLVLLQEITSQTFYINSTKRKRASWLIKCHMIMTKCSKKPNNCLSTLSWTVENVSFMESNNYKRKINALPNKWWKAMKYYSKLN